MTPGAPECSAPGCDLVGSKVWSDAFVALTVAVGSSAVSEVISSLAGHIVIEGAGVGAASVIGCSGKADIQVAFSGAGGMQKGCIIRVAFLAICYAGIILVMLGMATRITGSTTAGWCSVAFVAVGGRYEVGCAPRRRRGFKVTVDIGTGT